MKTNSNQMKEGIPDIMSALLKPFQAAPPSGQDLLMLQGDSRVIVVAGRYGP